MSSSNTSSIKPPSPYYDEDVLYGSRREALRIVDQTRNRVRQECVTHLPRSIDVDRIELWYLDNLKGRDRRLNSMLTGMGLECTLPVQSVCWPQMNRGTFPFVCISARGTGKTYSHILFIVSTCITSIPIAAMNELLQDRPSTFRTTDNVDKEEKIDLSELSGIDQNNFDFNTIGDNSNEQNKENEGATSNNNTVDKSKKSEDFISYPKYIIVCSSQMSVDTIDKEIDRLKSFAFESRIPLSKRQNITPIVRTTSIHLSDDNLYLACSQAEVLITTPKALLNCLNLNFVKFSKSKMVIFDDIDLTLKLHNAITRDLVKLYLQQAPDYSKMQNGSSDIIKGGCQMYVFARKWSDLVQHFISTIFSQRILIFGSLCEATLYANTTYELEIHNLEQTRLRKLVGILQLFRDNSAEDHQLAIFCNDTDEAKKLSIYLNEKRFTTQYLYSTMITHTHFVTKSYINRQQSIRPIYVLSDDTIDSIADHVHKVNHIVHYSFPEEFHKFDRRFKLMYSNLKNLTKGLLTSVFLDKKDSIKNLKELYDVISRSNTTVRGTKAELRDFIKDRSTNICWRWASTGQCRLEKLSLEDHFGSYCSDRHSIPSGSSSRWPSSGQFKILITNLVSPNEFYFHFEAHRDKNSAKKHWSQLEKTGSDFMLKLQEKLNQFRNAPLRSVKLEDFSKEKVYGIYFPHEERVDRITLLDLPKLDQLDQLKDNQKLYKEHYGLAYDDTYEVWRIDHGKRVEVFLRNIFEIPKSLAAIEAQARRGFYIGMKPADNEPNWVHKAKKHFHDNVAVDGLHAITVWIRFQNNNCFWFENMLVVRKLASMDNYDLLKTEPHKELCQAGLAERTPIEPPWLIPSERLETISKWHVDGLNELAQHAFLKPSKLGYKDIFVLHITGKLELIIRQCDFNKQLLELERKITADFYEDRLVPLNYFAEGVYCVAKILEGTDPKTKQPIYAMNRCEIVYIEKTQVNEDNSVGELEDLYEVYCLDHGDHFEVTAKDLYLASPKHLSELPFQAINCSLADLNENIVKDPDQCTELREFVYNVTRDSTDRLKKSRCVINRESKVYLYVKEVDNTMIYKPLISLVGEKLDIQLITNDDPDLRLPMVEKNEDEEEKGEVDPIPDKLVRDLIKRLLREMVEQEFSLAVKIAQEVQ